MIIRNIIYIALLMLQYKLYCCALCRTTNDRKNHTCTGFRLNQISITPSTRKELLRVIIEDCKDTDIAENAVNFPKAEHLLISCDTIRNVHKNAFQSVNNLKELNLKSNKISSLPAEVFLPNQKLQVLNLSNNLFETLTKDILKNIPNLKILCLSHNIIKNIDIELFKNNKELEELYLDDNQIDFIPTTLFKSVPKLTTLDLSYNLIEILTAAYTNNYKLEHLNISNNMIKELSEKIFDTNNMKLLDLSFNHLSVIHEDSLPLQTIQELFLQNNQIYSFDVTANEIADYPLSVLDLRNNRLVYLEDSFIKNTKYLSILKVDNNPWDCKCFEQIVLSHDEKVELGIDYRTGEEPLCVYENKESCVININDIDNYYKILEQYWNLR